MSHFGPWKRFRLSQAAACALPALPLHVSDSDVWGRVNMIECLHAWELIGVL